MSGIQNLQKFDPFVDANRADDQGNQEGLIHVRMQLRSGRKTPTTVQGISDDYGKKKIVKACRKKFARNGTAKDHPECGGVIQLQGNQRSNICAFLTRIQVFAILTIAFNLADATIVNEKIDRVIDLSSSVVKISDRIYLSDNVGAYEIFTEPNGLAYLEASINGQQIEHKQKSATSFEVNLNGKAANPLVVKSIYTRSLQPHPAEITQSQRQLVRYDGHIQTLSPYATKTTTTRVKLPQGSRLESFTRASKMTTGTNKLTYGPFKDIQPNQADHMSIHYENNSPFLAITSLTRNVEISPWSRSIYISNEVKVSHIGAKLKGPFSRIDFQRDHMNGISSVRNLNAELPRTAQNVYYRDGIGNISTSNIKYLSTTTLVNLKPRFPLFGGWVTDFNLGYRVPSADFIKEPSSGNEFVLRIPFTDVLYENMVIDDATVSVTLPAGAKLTEVGGSFKSNQYEQKVSYSYLDAIGRPVIVLKKRNIVTDHIEGKPLIIRYQYSRVYMGQEPVLVVLASFGLILLTALWNRARSPKSRS